ncbi:MAG: PASTA domain-containing protein [Oscillospiraceae bacterium]|nr:PASTA domain-containing protein [Oscillospiraceae bacterium]
MNIDDLCMSCMHQLNGEKQCPYCGYYTDSPQISPYLPLKSPIGDKYIVGKVLSSNSEGATYMAYDTERKTAVVIREFLPEKFIDRGYGSTELSIKEEWRDYYYIYLRKFLDLWRSLARMRGLSALIPVVDIIECNNTAYAVTEYIESISLREFLLKSRTGYLNWEKAKVLFMPVLSTLAALHNAGITHNGINPDTLLIGRDGKLRLTGFSISDVRIEGGELAPELFDGYTPIEQYGYNYENGHRSDVYSFCAVVYRALVGSVPQDAVSRSANDKLIIPARYAEIIPVYVINALMNGLQVDPAERTKDIETLREELSATPSNVVSSFSGVNIPSSDENENKTVSPQNEEETSSTGKTILISFLIFLGVGLLIFGVWFAFDRISEKMQEPSSTEPQTENSETIEVPDFYNTSYDMVAQNPVQNARFSIKSTFEYSNDIEKGYIISQSIEAGTVVPTGTEIIFVVSRGPEYVIVPDVVGLSVDFAKQRLEEAGFVVNVIEKENNGDFDEGVVSEVTPEEGSSRIKGTEVYIQVWGAPPMTFETIDDSEETEETTRRFSIFDFFG